VTRTKESLSPELRAAIEAAQEKQAAAITLLELRDLGAFTDDFLLCTGFSARQVEAICDEIELREKHLGIPRLHREGKAGAEWVLVDFGSFIVHVFTERARFYYDLERLWRAARRTDFTPPLANNIHDEAAEAER
jgi:ribosome-associated protein